MKKLLAVTMIASALSGCITVNKNDGGNSSITPVQIKDRIHLKYSVDKKTVSASDRVHCLFGFICWGSSASHIADCGEGRLTFMGQAKDGAYANACDLAKCDHIAGARYKVTTKDYFIYKNCKAEITGYPVKVVDAVVVDPPKQLEITTDNNKALGGLL